MHEDVERGRDEAQERSVDNLLEAIPRMFEVEVDLSPMQKAYLELGKEVAEWGQSVFDLVTEELRAQVGFEKALLEPEWELFI